ncbi:MAG TPA: BamA/TamA family outer membrane protein, partial [Nitrospiraceae bacterium]|nr:BamA/TamA family outer membrane protein [Nitrospiraceae bacterium]
MKKEREEDLIKEERGGAAPTVEPELAEKLFGKGNYTYIPLPAFAYNRNETYYIGALMPILKSNDKKQINDIYAPQYLYNQFVGHSGTLNYYGYHGDTGQYRMIVNWAEKVQRNIDFSYKDLGAGGGRFIIGGQGNYFRNPFSRFFGFGNSAPLYAESNFTAREIVGNVYIGLNISPDFSILLTERYRDVKIEQGIIPSLPDTQVAFASASGVEGAQIFGTRLTFLYDTRDSQLTPIKGSYVNFSTEFNTNVQHDEPNRWLRFTLDARHLFPHDGDSKIFVVRLFIDGVMRTDRTVTRTVPFYERPTLGGETTLRAFGLNRYIDDSAYLLNIEERILVMKRLFFEHEIDLEIAPTLDVGRVLDLDRGGVVQFKNMQVNP